VARLPAESPGTQAEEELSIALIGQPNVGKSSLLNALLNEERAIVSDVPGTTRDAIDTIFQFHEHRIRLIDTAGVRRKATKHGAIEYYSSLRSLRAIARCDIALLLIDSMQGPLNADRRLAGIALEERKGLIIVGNKWDLVRAQGEYSQGELVKEIHALVPFASFAPVTFLSALTKRKLGGLMPLIMKVAANLDRRIPTAKLNAIVRDAVLAHPPPLAAGKALKIFYCAQVAAHPPLFVFHCNEPDYIQSSYKRFIENVLRSNFDFEGVPLTLEFRERSRVELAT
jgi:GTP-binding protein